jgi:predicted lipoprotein with Yx(FWY)xxD motif
MKRSILAIPVAVVVLAVAAVAAIAHSSGGGASTGTPATASAYGAASMPATASAYGAAGTPATASAYATSTAATISTASHGLGTMLVDAQGRTLYLWKADTGHQSTCSGACASAWPPATTKGKPKARGAAKASLLSTAKRSDGTTQVTYAGHPLYRFQGDAKAGQHNGQASDAFGAAWLVVAPGGKAITRGAS